jgi:malate dehydrogenase (oxaloacetate-decarboxylating)(NADP+)
MRPDLDFELVDPQGDARFREYWTLYHELMERRGVSPDYAKTIVRTRNTVIAALMVRRNEADALICGTVGRYRRQLNHILEVIGLAPGMTHAFALNALVLPTGNYFLCDTQVTSDPTAEQIAEMTIHAAREVQRFGIAPKAALLSHSNFGTADSASAVKMRQALALIRDRWSELEVEGEMHGDAAINEAMRERLFPNSRLTGQANLLIMPSLDAAHISFNLLKAIGVGQSVGPMLIGPARPAHVVVPSITVRGIVNMSAIAVVDAQAAGAAQ